MADQKHPGSGHDPRSAAAGPNTGRETRGAGDANYLDGGMEIQMSQIFGGEIDDTKPDLLPLDGLGNAWIAPADPIVGYATRRERKAVMRVAEDADFVPK